MPRTQDINNTVFAVWSLYHNNYLWFRELDQRPGLRSRVHRIIKSYVREAYDDIELHDPGSTDTPCEEEMYYATIDMVLWTIENFNE